MYKLCTQKKEEIFNYVLYQLHYQQVFNFNIFIKMHNVNLIYGFDFYFIMKRDSFA